MTHSSEQHSDPEGKNKRHRAHSSFMPASEEQLVYGLQRTFQSASGEDLNAGFALKVTSALYCFLQRQ